TTSIHIQPWDGKIVVGGWAQPTPTTQYAALARYNSDGTLDSSFGTAGTLVLSAYDFGGVHDLAFQPDHQILVSTSDANLALLRLNGNNGSLDTSFNGTGIVIAPGALSGGQLILPGDGSILEAGRYSDGAVVARFSGSGALDPTFGVGGYAF